MKYVGNKEINPEKYLEMVMPKIKEIALYNKIEHNRTQILYTLACLNVVMCYLVRLTWHNPLQMELIMFFNNIV